jgi:hypothetical protein
MAYTVASGLNNRLVLRRVPQKLVVLLVMLAMVLIAIAARPNNIGSRSQAGPSLAIRFLAPGEDNKSNKNKHKDSTANVPVTSTPSSFTPASSTAGNAAPSAMYSSPLGTGTVSVPDNTSSTQLVGGMGGGTAPAPTASVSPPTTSTGTQQGGILPLQTTVTVPPTSVNVGSKPVISTDGTTITVN